MTVECSKRFHDNVTDAIETLAANDSVGESLTLSLTSYEELLKTFTATTLKLIETIRQEEPTSMNEAARAVDRDVKNVHEQLVWLENLGVIYFAEEGQAKCPVVWFDEPVMRVPFASESNHAAAAP